MRDENLVKANAGFLTSQHSPTPNHAGPLRALEYINKHCHLSSLFPVFISVSCAKEPLVRLVGFKADFC